METGDHAQQRKEYSNPAAANRAPVVVPINVADCGEYPAMN
jgi:hypothetical protein